MANTDTPLGFRPYRHRGGGVSGRTNEYKIADAYSTSIYRGDAVILSSGVLNIAAENSATLVGIFAGCRYRDTTGATVWSPYWPASTSTYNSEGATALVYDDPMQSYYCQTDTGTAYVDATHKGNVYDIELDHSGSTTTGNSGMEIDLNDTGTGQFLLLGLIDEPGNAAGVNAKVEVMVKESLLKAN